MLEYFPDPYPDELLYSVWARFSDQVRYPNHREIMQELFGSKSFLTSAAEEGAAENERTCKCDVSCNEGNIRQEQERRA